MIKTESTRFIISTEYVVPPDVQKALDDYNATHPFHLELHFDEGTKKWQFYNLKQRGVTKDQDILHWQMSVPFEGTIITPGIIDWLKRYDTSQGGLLSKEELQENWKKNLALMLNKQKERKEKVDEELSYYRKHVIYDLSVEIERVSVPITVGYNKETKKKILAVPKGTARRMKKQKEKIKHGN